MVRWRVVLLLVSLFPRQQHQTVEIVMVGVSEESQVINTERIRVDNSGKIGLHPQITNSASSIRCF